MINDGSAEAVRGFETSHRSPRRLAETPIETRIGRVRDMHQRWAPLTVEEIQTVAFGDDTVRHGVASSAAGPSGGPAPAKRISRSSYTRMGGGRQFRHEDHHRAIPDQVGRAHPDDHARRASAPSM
jgi:hypothetical protein